MRAAVGGGAMLLLVGMVAKSDLFHFVAGLTAARGFEAARGLAVEGLALERGLAGILSLGE